MKMTYAPFAFLLMLFPVSMIEITPQRDYPIRPVAFTQVKITDAFWQPRLETNRRVTIPFAFKKCEETGRIDNFLKAAGRMPGPFQGKRYNDSDVYKIIEGAAYSLSLERYPELERYLDTLIETIAAAQEPDGYLYAARTIDPRNPPPGAGQERWSLLESSHELYNAGHLYEAAAAYFQATGKRALLEVALKNAEHRNYSHPGSWNDPDYIQIGRIGNARGMGEPIDCPLTPNEQYAFMSLWCLMASPLFFSGDMGLLDPFTVNVLCNPEVIDVDQDPLGQSARVIPCTEETFVMVKDLEDGSKAVGLFNRGEMGAKVTAKWADLGVTGQQIVRDLWRQRDLGSFDNEYTVNAPRHGGVMVRLRAAR